MKTDLPRIVLALACAAGLSSAAFAQEAPKDVPPPAGDFAPKDAPPPPPPGLGDDERAGAPRDGERRRRRGRDLSSRLREMFRESDANKDGALTPDEVSDPAIFERLDRNKDGKIDKADRELMAQEMRSRLWKRLAKYDTNGDGALDRTELAESPRVLRMLDRFDKNEDGKLVESELPKSQSRRERGNRRGPNADMLKKRFGEMDANANGSVERTEFRGNDAAFQKLDANSDGSIQESEWIEGRSKPSRGEDGVRGRRGERGERGRRGDRSRFEEMDKNGDGKISKEEFPGPDGLFDRLDRNGDGVLDPQDRRQRGERGRRRGPKPEGESDGERSGEEII